MTQLQLVLEDLDLAVAIHDRCTIARRERGEQRQYLAGPEALAIGDLTFSINCMEVKYVLRNVQTKCCDFPWLIAPVAGFVHRQHIDGLDGAGPSSHRWPRTRRIAERDACPAPDRCRRPPLDESAHNMRFFRRVCVVASASNAAAISPIALEAVKRIDALLE
ncbi:hypothetical protein [Bradyrhizobium sp. RT5a]|uniref:hypothetical protein n=1 Tax=unclassified Bradyrhizobium TaxID=2631580 RepID=UPI003392ADA0